MTAVTLRPEGDGVYRVDRGSDRWQHQPIVIHRFLDWEITERRAAASARMITGRLVEARLWLDSPDGRAYLDSLREESGR